VQIDPVLNTSLLTNVFTNSSFLLSTLLFKSVSAAQGLVVATASSWSVVTSEWHSLL
jgi:hypothetical protein